MGNQQVSVKLEDVLNQTKDNNILQMTNAFVQQDISMNQFFDYVENIDIRSLIKQHPNNFQIFLGIVIYNLLEYSLSNEIKQTQVPYLVNNLRIFIAVAPILHEIEFYNFSENFYWNKLVITRRQEFQQTVNGVALLFSLQKLFMMPNFTVNYTNVPWETLSGENLNKNKKYNENRKTLLQAILALFGATLYRHNHGEFFINPFIKFFTSPQNTKLDIIYISLLATVLQHKENGFIPFSSMTQTKIQRHDLALLSAQLVSIMMYETGNWDLANNQLENSLSIQAIYRNYINQFESKNPQQLTVNSVMSGIFSNQVSQILTEEVGGVAINSVQKFVKNLLDLIENPANFSQQLIYGSFGQIGFVEELLTIFYRYVTRNQKVYEYILGEDPSNLLNDQEKANNKKQSQNKELGRMFRGVMYCFCSSLEHQAINNSFFICLAIFIHFSESENFKQLLKRDLDFSFPSLRYFPVVGGSYGDFLVSCISQNIINGHFNNKNHYAYNQMALMTNISGILQNLSELTSNKLMQLMQVFTDFDFLLQNFYHPLCLIKLMDFIDNILALQADKNPNLIFELCKSSNFIQRAFNINFTENTLRGFLGDPLALERMQARMHNKSLNQDQKQPLSQQQYRKKKLPFITREPKKIMNPNEEQKQDEQFFNSFAHKLNQQEQENLINFWKNFEWQEYRKNMPRYNLEQVLYKVQEYLKESQKKQLNIELVQEMCKKNIFKGIVQITEKNYNTENFDLNGEIELILRSYTWSNVFAKSTQRPFFDPEKCVFFQRIDPQRYAEIFDQDLNQYEGEEGEENGEQQDENSLENHPSNDDINRLRQRKEGQYAPNRKQSDIQNENLNELEERKEDYKELEKYEGQDEDEEEEEEQKQGGNQNNSQNKKNLYVISEADSRKEETMMMHQLKFQKRFSNQLDIDEQKLRDKTLNSSRLIENSGQRTTEHKKSEFGSLQFIQNFQKDDTNNLQKQNQNQNSLQYLSKYQDQDQIQDNQQMGDIENQIQEQIELEQFEYEKEKKNIAQQNEKLNEQTDSQGEMNDDINNKKLTFKGRNRKSKVENQENQSQIQNQGSENQIEENIKQKQSQNQEILQKIQENPENQEDLEQIIDDQDQLDGSINSDKVEIKQVQLEDLGDKKQIDQDQENQYQNEQTDLNDKNEIQLEELDNQNENQNNDQNEDNLQNENQQKEEEIDDHSNNNNNYNEEKQIQNNEQQENFIQQGSELDENLQNENKQIEEKKEQEQQQEKKKEQEQEYQQEELQENQEENQQSNKKKKNRKKKNKK